MIKKKSLVEMTYDQYLDQYGKHHRYCVRFSTHGRTICINYYQALAEAVVDAVYISFDEIWTDSPLVYKDYPPEKEAERVEIMEWSEPTRRDAQILLAAKTEQKRIRVVENIFLKYGTTLALKASFYLKERRTKKKDDYIKGLYLSDTLGLYVGANNQPQVNIRGTIPPLSHMPQQPSLNVVSN